MKKFLIAGLILAVAVLTMAALSSLRKAQPRAKPKPFVRTVLTQTARYDSLRPRIAATGRVYALERVSLAPEVSGVVENRNFRLRKGMSFAKGQALMSIDSRQARYALEGTVSDLRNALTGLLAELKTDIPDAHERWQSFFTELDSDNLPGLPGTSSQREKLLATRYNVYKLYYSAKSQQVSLSKHSINAPFSGTVEESMIYPSSMARAGAAVATIVRTDVVEIELALPESEARFVTRGMRAAVTSEGIGDTIPATVHRVSDVLDERMQTVAVFVRVRSASKQGLKSGAYAAVELAGKSLEHAFAIGRKAIHDKNRVYVIEDGALAEKTVDIAYLGINTAYVTGGVDDGAMVVAEPLQDAVLGMAVRSADEEKRGTEKATPRGGKTDKKG